VSVSNEGLHAALDRQSKQSFRKLHIVRDGDEIVIRFNV
jgi:hypothetical protein